MGITATPLVRAGAVSPPPELPAHGPILFPLAGDEAEVAAARRDGLTVTVEPPLEVERRDLAVREHAAGRSAVDAIRVDPTLLPWMRLATWADAAIPERLLRRARLRLRAGHASVSYWLGARDEATPEEWRWLTSSYCALLYHRLAGELREGQERVDVSPTTFRRHLRALRALGFRFPTFDELVGFHLHRTPLPPRSVVVTVDDGTADVVTPLLESASFRPQLFVVTQAGGAASWLGRAPLATEEDLRALTAAGVVVGAHSRTHADLAAPDVNLAAEVQGSVGDIRAAVGAHSVPFAYPNGRFDERSVVAVELAGCPYAFGTLPGANGVGVDRYALRRVSAKEWDSAVSIAWKAATGRPVPAMWEAWLVRRYALARRLRS